MEANSRGFLAYAAVGVLLATISAFLVKAGSLFGGFRVLGFRV